MLGSLTRHFIADEHWCWFDDRYLPDYTLSRIWDWFIPHIRSGALAGESFEELEAGLTEIEASKAYQEYHVPRKDDALIESSSLNSFQAMSINHGYIHLIALYHWSANYYHRHPSQQRMSMTYSIHRHSNHR